MISENGDKKVLGIIGGMGPLATADLFYKIIMLTDASSDAEHIHILIDNNPKTPDRTAAVLCGSDASFVFTAKSAQRLERMGADILLMPCNTSHVFYSQLCESLHIPVINMIEEVAAKVGTMGTKKVGLLATNGTLHAKLYESALDKYGIQTIRPSQRGQQEVMALIYNGVKAGAGQYDTSLIKKELKSMMDEGAESFILGCTELPVAFQRYGIAFPFVDSSVILARAAIEKAGYSIKNNDLLTSLR